MQKIKTLISSFFILIGAYMLYGILLSILSHFVPSIDLNTYKQDGILDLLKSNLLRAFILIVVFAPIAEEMMFRTLVRPRHLDIILFLAVWPVFFLVRFVPLDVHWAVKIAFTLIFLFAVTYIGGELLPKNRTITIRNWLNRHKNLLLIITSLIFGFVHITNYVEAFTINLTLFLLILPRIIAGFMLGFVKLKNTSLIWSMLLHAMNNGMAFAFIIFFRNGI